MVAAAIAHEESEPRVILRVLRAWLADLGQGAYR
jgi:hypothetical protein